MLSVLNRIFLAVLICLLSACATTNTVKTPEQEQKIKTAKINAQLGIAYLERHNLQRAKQKLLLALEQGPNIPETWYSMAYFLEATGNKDDASIYYQKAISIAPARGDAQNNYGTFLCRNGDYRGAVEHFMLAVKDPTYLDPADAYENAGLCALKIPDNKMAAKYFAQAITQDPARTVSERKLKELNKYLAMDDTPNAGNAAPPKKIAYNSLRQHHEDDEDDEESGLVKVPDLIKAKKVSVAAPINIESPANVVSPKQVRAKATKVNAHQSTRVEKIALKSKAKKKIAAKFKSKHIKPTKLASQFRLKKRVAANVSHKPKAKLVRAAAKRKHHHPPLEGVVTV